MSSDCWYYRNNNYCNPFLKRKEKEKKVKKLKIIMLLLSYFGATVLYSRDYLYWFGFNISIWNCWLICLDKISYFLDCVINQVTFCIYFIYISPLNKSVRLWHPKLEKMRLIEISLSFYKICSYFFLPKIFSFLEINTFYNNF